MIVLLLHISDVHFFRPTDHAAKRAASIAAAASSAALDAEACIVLLTGDLVQSGKGPEYEVAEAFLNDLLHELRTRLTSCRLVSCISTPGNHDCDFATTQSARAYLLTALAYDGKTGAEAFPIVDEGTLEQLLSPQQEYRNFVTRTAQHRIEWTTVSNSKILDTHSCKIGETLFVIHSFNSACGSSLHESPATLIAPRFSLGENAEQSIVVTMLHHPYAWFHPETARQLRKAIETASDIVLTGHEHVSSKRRVTDDLEGEFTHIEGAVLQDRNSPHRSGFNSVAIDTHSKEHRFYTFTLSGSAYRAVQPLPRPWTPLPLNRFGARRSFHLTRSHSAFLADPGANVFHKSSASLSLRDFFVYPDLEVDHESETEAGPTRVNARHLRANIGSTPVTLVVGDTAAGKTSLAKIMFEGLYNGGLVPVFIPSGALLLDPQRLEGVVATLFAQQYEDGDFSSFLQLPPRQRVAIVDEFEKSPAAQGRRLSVTALSRIFNAVVLFSNDIVSDIEDLTDPDTPRYPKYRLLPFGHIQVNELTERWHCIGSAASADILNRRVRETTRQIDSILGKGFVPHHPLYLLVILQATEGSTPIDTNISTSGYYYELLIRAELLRGSTNKDYDVLTGYLAFVAFQAFRAGGPTMSTARHVEFHKAYEEAYAIDLGLDSLLERLCQHRMLQRINDAVSFRYKYVYYYFVASYLRDHLSEDNIRAIISDLTQRTYEQECADILLFLAHLSKDPFVVSTILARASTHYEGFDQVASLGEVSSPADLPRVVSDIVRYHARDVGDVRREQAEQRDKYLSLSQVERDAEISQALAPVRDLTSAFRTLQILGQILKNYPGHLDARTKLSLAQAGFGMGARLWTAMYRLFRENNDAFVKELIDTVRVREPGIPDNQLSAKASAALKSLVRLLGYSVVRRVADALGAPELGQTYQKLRHDEGHSQAVELVWAAIHLDHSPETPEVEIESVYRGLDDGPLATWILRSLVVSHFYMFPVDLATRQRMCAALDIEFARTLTGGERVKRLPEARKGGGPAKPSAPKPGKRGKGKG